MCYVMYFTTVKILGGGHKTKQTKIEAIILKTKEEKT